MFVIKALSFLPLILLYWVADILFFLSYYVVGYRKKVVIDNIRNSFPDKSDIEIKRVVKKFYRSLADFGVEMVKAQTMKPEQFKKRVKFTNLEILDNYKDKPVMFMASHQFNWEWMQLSACLQFPFEIDYIYQKLSNSRFDKFMLDLRSRFGAHAIERQTAAREIMRRREGGRGFAMVSDQVPGRDSKKYWTSFLNQETAFFIGTEMIAKLIQCPVLYFACHKVKRGYYEIEIKEIASPPHDRKEHTILENYAKATENVIQKYPSGWLWSHKRWKYKRMEMKK